MTIARPKIAYVSALVLAAACTGQLIPVAQETVGAGADSGSTASAADGAALPNGVSRSDTISGLGDAQAAAVCAWLAAQFPGSQTLSDPTAGEPPGYAAGPSTGCGGPSISSLAWILLSPQDCVLNLRHSPCAASVGSLADCVHAFVSPASNPGPCFGACTPFVTAPSCMQTVFDGFDAGCGAGQPAALPISPSATCNLDGGG